MAKCTYCGQDTKLYHRDEPICGECADLIDAGLPPKQPVEESAPLKVMTAGS